MGGRKRIHHRRAAIHHALLHGFAVGRGLDNRGSLRGIGRAEHLADDLGVAPRLVATQAKPHKAVPHARLGRGLGMRGGGDDSGNQQSADQKYGNAHRDFLYIDYTGRTTGERPVSARGSLAVIGAAGYSAIPAIAGNPGAMHRRRGAPSAQRAGGPPYSAASLVADSISGSIPSARL